MDLNYSSMMDSNDGRLQFDAQLCMDEITNTLQGILPFSGQEAEQSLQELKPIVIKCEENIDSAATSESDYPKRKSLGILPMDSKSQKTLFNSNPSKSASMSRIPQDSGSLGSPCLCPQCSNNKQPISYAGWQEETYQKLQAMKDMYFTEIQDMYRKVCMKLQQETPLEQTNVERIEKLRLFKHTLERLMEILQKTKCSISPFNRDKLQLLEKQVGKLVNNSRSRPSRLPVPCNQGKV